MAQSGVLPQRIVDRKTIILKPRLDLTLAKMLGEELKARVFVKMGFFKVKPENVKFVSIKSFYEPYILVGGKYIIDYCRKTAYSFEINQDTQEVALLGKKIKPELSPDASSSNVKAIKLDGTEFSRYEDSACCILDKIGREIKPDVHTHPLFSVFFEKQALEKSAKTGPAFVNVEISPEEEMKYLKSKIANRPSDVGEILKESFEVDRRALIYTPFYQLEYENLNNGRTAIARLDGITGRVRLARFGASSPTKRLIEACTKGTSTIERQLVELERNVEPSNLDNSNSNRQVDSVNAVPPAVPLDSSSTTGENGFVARVDGASFQVGDNITAIVGDLEIPSRTNLKKTLVVKGNLRIGAHCHISGKMKALKGISIGDNTTIEGNVVSGGNLNISHDCFITGSVESVGKAKIAQNVIIVGSLYSRSSVVLASLVRISRGVTAAGGLSVEDDNKRTTKGSDRIVEESLVESVVKDVAEDNRVY